LLKKKKKKPLPAPGIRSPSLRMGAEKKTLQLDSFDDSAGVFEVREVDVSTPPIYLLSGIEKTGAATWAAEAGLLSKAEEAGVFSTLESLGAFSLAEKALPTIEKLKLLSLFEKCLEIPNGFLFTGALTLLTFPPNLLMLQGFGIVPGVRLPTGPFVPLELAVDVAALTAGAALFALAFAVGKIQENA